MELNKTKKNNIFILIGPPGVGKGTLAQNCKEKLKWKHLSTGLLCRKFSEIENDLGKKIKDLIDNGSLIDDNLMLEMLAFDFKLFFEEKKENNNLLLDGFPRNEKQVEKLINFLNFEYKNEEKSIVFIILNADEKIILDRLKNRKVCSNKKCEKIFSINDKIDFCDICNSPIIKRKDDDIFIIEKRLKFYNENKNKILKIIDFFNLNKIEISANISKEDLFNNFLKLINKFMKEN
jgi:adenylate kinase